MGDCKQTALLSSLRNADEPYVGNSLDLPLSQQVFADLPSVLVRSLVILNADTEGWEVKIEPIRADMVLMDNGYLVGQEPTQHVSEDYFFARHMENFRRYSDATAQLRY